MMAAGVLTGTKKPYHDITSKPGSPDSATVGNSGALGKRSALLTPSARTLPARTCGMVAPAVLNIMVMRPGIRSFIAGPAPR